VNNKLDIPAGPLRIQRESLGPCLESHSTRGPSLTSATVRSLSDPRSLYDICNCQVPLQPHLYRIIHQDIQLGRIHPTSLSPDLHSKSPPQRLTSTLDTAQRQDSLIHGVRCAVRLSPRSKYFRATISVGAVMDSSRYLVTLYYLSSYEEITMCKSCAYGDPKYSRPQSQCYRIFMHLDIHREKGSHLSCKHKNIS